MNSSIMFSNAASIISSSFSVNLLFDCCFSKSINSSPKISWYFENIFMIESQVYLEAHDNVLRAIDDIADLSTEVSKEMLQFLGGQTIEEFCKENYFEHKYKDESGKLAREVLMTKKGSMLLVMGFKGAKALIFKIGLLNRFEVMERFIVSLETARIEHPAFTAAIMDAHEEPKHYHFSNEADMINRIVLGMSAKKFREMNDIPKGESIRPYLSMEQIQAVETLQRVDIGLIVAIPEYEERKKTLAQYYERMQLRRIA